MSSYNSKKFYGPEEPENESSNKSAKNHITINFTFNIGNTDFHFAQRAEGGGQINHDVGTNANQGGQNASNGSHTRNVNSQFADCNGAGNKNDEAGEQQGIKERDSLVIDSDNHASSNHSKSNEVENDGLTEEGE